MLDVMTQATLTPQEREVRNQAYIDALEFADPVIMNMSLEQPRVFVNLVRRGSYANGQGLVRRQDMFHGDPGMVYGATGWKPIQVTRAAGTDGENDPGYDACKQYDAELVEHGWEDRTYTGFYRNRRTYDVCINDLKWKDRFQEQLSLVFGNLAEVTLGEWEAISLESYVNQTQKYVMAGGQPNGTTFTYNPFTSTQITISNAIEVSSLNWDFFRWWHIYLSLSARGSAQGTMNGQPVWPLVIDPEDFDKMLHSDSALVSAFQYAKPNVLIENYGVVTEFKGYTLHYCMTLPRFNVVARGASTLTLERVPLFTVSAATKGSKWTVNADYINAGYAFAIVYMPNSIELQVPQSGPASPGGGTRFGTQPGLNGTFSWVNILHRTDNPFGEIGHFFARLQAFIKPLMWYGRGLTVLYKRCIDNDVLDCSPGDSTPGSGAIADVDIAAVAVVGDDETEALYTGVRVTLASILPCEKPTVVTVTYDTDKTALATIVEDSYAPTYTLVFATAAAWATLLGTAFTVQCGDQT